MKCNYPILLFNLIIISSFAQPETAKVGHYLFPEFTQGLILFKTGKTDSKLLNYNSLTEQLVFDTQGTVLAVPKEQLDRIDTVFIKERRFIILNHRVVELLTDAAAWDLYVEYKCALKEKGKDAGFGGTSQTSAINTPSAVHMGGNVYNLQLPDGFETKKYSVYFLVKNGKLNELINMRQLKKLYKDKNDLFNDYVKVHDVKYENQELITQLIVHLESN